MHDSETWPMKVEHELKLNRTEMSMIRWMCGVKLSERKKSEALYNTVRVFFLILCHFFELPFTIFLCAVFTFFVFLLYSMYEFIINK